ncbi:MAG: hypothetical protein ACI87W_002096 [Halieaceae bacterium]
MRELYFKAGSMKTVAAAQQAYISSNHTHIARDPCARGVNVLCQMLAFREETSGLRLSLSSNPDTAIDLIAILERERPGAYVVLGQLHPDLPLTAHDVEVIKRLIAVADSRFQRELLEFARGEGKVESDYEVPAMHCNNTPARIGAMLKGARAQGLLPDYPFGTELTDEEIQLAASLRRLKALSDEPAHFIARAFRALLHHAHTDAAKPYLERIHLEHPHSSREFLVQQLLLLDLEERGLLRVS